MRQKRAVPTALARERHSRTVRIDHSRRPFEERNSTTAGALDPLHPTVCSGWVCLGAIGVPPPTRPPSVRARQSRGPTGFHHSRDLGALSWPREPHAHTMVGSWLWKRSRLFAIWPWSARRRLHAALADEGRGLGRRHELDHRLRGVGLLRHRQHADGEIDVAL